MAAEQKRPVVLIAVDPSDHTARAVDWYIELLHKPIYKVVLVNVVEMTLSADSVLQIEEDLDINFWQEVSDRAEKLKKELVEKFKANKIEDVEARVIEGKRPGEAIVEEAGQQGASFIVMGTRGMGTIRRTILGSVSDYVMHHAHCPVLVYRPPAGEGGDSLLSKYSHVGAV